MCLEKQLFCVTILLLKTVFVISRVNFDSHYYFKGKLDPKPTRGRNYKHDKPVWDITIKQSCKLGQRRQQL